MTHYNPYTAVLKSLTCGEAMHYYAIRAQQDIGIIIWVVGIAAEIAYDLGVMARQIADEFIEDSQIGLPKVRPCLPAPAITALPDVSTSPRRILVTPVPESHAKDLIAALTGNDEVRTDAYLKLTKQQLIERCVMRGLQPRKSYSKAKLAEMLTRSYTSGLKPYQHKSRGGKVFSVA